MQGTRKPTTGVQEQNINEENGNFCGGETVKLNITVVDNEEPTLATGSSAVTVVLVLVFISITGLILGVVYRHIGKHLEPLTWHELNSTLLYK
ncbi:hypothetical protein ATANTOWER_002864, partial [Ataeniobius toweri]|nr:hypothetical protein [Ataeniobius toweri]